MPDVLLRCEHVHKSYILGRTALPVLRGVDLSVRAGQFIAIIGASGSGKSTLLHVMSGLDIPQRGQVYYRQQPLFEPEDLRQIPVGRDAGVGGIVDAPPRRGPPATKNARGQHVRGWDDLRLLQNRRNTLLNAAFGFVFQFYYLLPEFDVLENVLLPAMVGRSIGRWLALRGAGNARAIDLLSRVGLQDRMHHRPNELSGGERQRVAIARALMNDPDVLFADEPTGNLDTQTGRGILRLLKELNKSGQTIIMVTHNRELARHADRLVQLVDGRVQ